MKKSLSLWRMIVGLTLCGFMLTAALLPRYSLNAGRVGKICGKFVGDNVSGLLGGLYDGKNEADRIEKEVTEGVEKLIGDLEEHNLPYRFSDFYIMSHSVQQIEEIKQLSELVQYYKYLRVYVILLILMTLLLLTGILLSRFAKLTKWIVIASAWMLLLLETAYAIVVAVILPAKMGSAMRFMGMDLSAAGTQISRQLIWCLHGAGFYAGLVLMLLLFVWSIWCCIPAGKKNSEMIPTAGQEKPVLPLQPVQSASMQPKPEGKADQTVQLPQQAKGDIFITMPEQRLAGRILGVAGTMMGAEIPLNSEESIVVGRDPAMCQLILEDVRISRKHCLIQYNQITGQYHVECYSKNGVRLSDNRVIAVSQSAEAACGTKIIMADGKEVLLLD